VPISTEALVSAAANRLKLIQLMSVGYDRFNLDGAREAKLPVSVNGAPTQSPWLSTPS